MSYEGRTQVICKNGHYFERDCFSNYWCPECNEKDGWSNQIDDTNGESAGLIPYETLSEKFLAVAAVVEVCNLGHSHVLLPAIFKVPTRDETDPLRIFKEYLDD